MSRFLNKSKALFLHVPRTGGTWITSALDESGVSVSRWNSAIPRGLPRKHGLLWHLRDKRRSSVKQSFAFVRHPKDYYQSVWTYLKSKGVDKRGRMLRRFQWHPFHPAIRQWRDDFPSWVLRMTQFEPRWMARLIDMYIGPEGAEFCDYVGRTEWLVTDFVKIMVQLGYEEDLFDVEQLRGIGRQNQNYYQKDDVYWPVLSYVKLVEDSEHEVIRRFYGDSFERLKYGAVEVVKT